MAQTDIEVAKEVAELKAELTSLRSVFDTILESSMAGYWDWRIPEGEEYMSPTFKAMFGYKDHEVPNTPDWWQANIHPDDLPKVLETFNKHVETKGKHPYDNDVRYFHKNGSIVWVYCRGKVIEWDKDGNPLRMVGSHVNITPVKEARSYLEEALQISDAGAWEWDIAKQNLIWDKQVHHLYGTKPKKGVENYTVWLSCLHPNDVERAEIEVKEALKGKSEYDTAYRVVWSDGQIRHIRAKGRVIWGENDKPLKMIGMSWDVTKDQHLVDELKDAKERFQLAVQGSSSGIWDWADMQSNKVWWSPKFYELLGYGYGEIEPTRESFRELMHPEDRTLGLEAFEKHLKGEKFYVEYRLRHKSGEYKWFKGTGQALFDKDGNPKRMVGTIMDISYRKRGEEELLESRKRFQLAVQGSSAGIWDWYDVNGDNEWWSPKFYELLGYQDKEMPATVEQFSEFLHPDDVKPTFDLVDKHFANKEPFIIEYRLKHKSGVYKWFLGSGQAEWDENGKPTRMVGSIIDIDERKKAEALVSQRTEQLKEKNKELQEFVFVASHDLQEPVRTISGFVDYFIDSYEDKLDEDGVQCLEYMKGSTERSQELIRDLLNYSRLGSNVKDKVALDMNKVVGNVKVDLHSKIKETEAEINFDNLPEILGYEVEIRLLLQNLIGNAIKFSKPGVSPIINISCNKGEDEWQFAVADNGIGFDKKHAHAVFVIFKQLHSREEYSGTGIGLAQCKRIVELHKGKIWVESEEGVGTTFYFNIPA